MSSYLLRYYQEEVPILASTRKLRPAEFGQPIRVGSCLKRAWVALHHRYDRAA